MNLAMLNSDPVRLSVPCC